MISKKIPQIIILGLFFVLYTIFQKANMFYILGTSGVLSTYSPILLFILSLAYVLFYKAPKNNDTTFNAFLVFQVAILLVTLFYTLFYPLTYILQYFIIPLPLLCAFFVKTSTLNINDESFINLSFISFLFLFIFYLQNHYIDLLMEEDAVTNASYTILYMLPLLLCSKKKSIRIVAIILTVVAVFMSIKRGSISALLVGLLIYFYIVLFKLMSNKSKLLKLIILCLACFICYECLLYFNTLSDNSILDRFNSIADDKGSGRLDIFKHTLEMIKNSSLLEVLFGHGWNMVIVDSKLGFSAHNDHLEILYDFGLIVYALYLVMLIRLLKLNVYLVKIKSELSAPMAMSLVIFLFGSIISHIVIYPYYMTIFAVTWSYIIVSFRNKGIV